MFFQILYIFHTFCFLQLQHTSTEDKFICVMRSSAIMAVQQIKLYKFSEIKSPLLREISVIPRPLKAERISLVANEKSF